MNELMVSTRLTLEARQFERGLRKSGRGVAGFSTQARRELKELRNAFGGIQGKIASLGLTIGTTALLMQNAKLTKSLTQIGQTAGSNIDQVKQLRAELFELTRDTGQELEGLKGGFNDLIQSGLDWRKSSATIAAINPASAVTGSDPRVLSGGLTVAAKAFDFDLSQPGLAVELIDKMVVAGRLGNAELEDLSGIFARVGQNAKRANLGFSQTLGFIEELSEIERNPERLATLADSTLRLFTNENYKRTAQKRLGVPFYDENDASRPAFDVLKDMRDIYQSLTSDKQRARFLQAGFGQTDLDTKKGLALLFSGDALDNVNEKVLVIEDAAGTIARDLPDALNNAVDQTGRLKAVLREAADGFTGPINEVISDAIKFGLDKDKLDLTGNQLVGGGVAAVVAAALATRYGGKGIKAMRGKIFGVASGVATGKVLEEAAGVTPVYVVNMPGEGFGLGGGKGRGGKRGGRGKRSNSAVVPFLDLPDDVKHKAGGYSVGGFARLLGWVGAGITAGEMGGSFYDNRVKGRAIETQAIEDWNKLLETLGLAAEKMDSAADKMGEAKATIEVDLKDGQVRDVQLSADERLELQVQTGMVVD